MKFCVCSNFPKLTLHSCLLEKGLFGPYKKIACLSNSPVVQNYLRANHGYYSNATRGAPGCPQKENEADERGNGEI